MNTTTINIQDIKKNTEKSPFPLDQWYMAGLASELTDKPVGRTFLNQKVVMFRTPNGQVAALEDRCCHKSLPLSCGKVEERGVRCGYHGLVYDMNGQCIEIPGQDRIPSKAKVRPYHLLEKDHLLWIWMPIVEGAAPTKPAPDYPHHDNPKYKWGGGMYHYKTPWQLIHDNLLDLSHLGYVHLKTIGGDAHMHMSAPTTVESEGDRVKVVRLMPGSKPPPTYKAGWPFGETCDRWQEIEFEPSHLSIWTGAMEPGTGSLEDPNRGGFHLRGLHGITPETDNSCHYFWTMSSNKHPDMPETIDKVLQAIEFTFNEDRVVIQQQYDNMVAFADRATWLDIHCDAGANRARRIIERLTKANAVGIE